MSGLKLTIRRIGLSQGLENSVLLGEKIQLGESQTGLVSEDLKQPEIAEERPLKFGKGFFKGEIPQFGLFLQEF